MRYFIRWTKSNGDHYWAKHPLPDGKYDVTSHVHKAAPFASKEDARMVAAIELALTAKDLELAKHFGEDWIVEERKRISLVSEIELVAMKIMGEI